MTAEALPIDLRRLLLVGVPIVVAVALVAASVAYVLSSRQPDKYRASATVLLRSVEQDPAQTGQSSDVEPDVVTATNALLISRQRIFERVAARPDIPLSAAQVGDAIATSTVNATNAVRITATTGDRTLTAELANAMAAEFVAARREGFASRIRETRRALRRQYRSLSPASRGSEGGLRLRERIESLQVLQRLGSPTPQILDYARPPREAFAPTPQRDAVLGGLIGVVLGLGLALPFVRSRRLSSAGAAGEASGLPVLAEFPRIRRGGPFGTVPEDERPAYGLLYANLRRAVGHEPVQRVGIVAVNDDRLAGTVAARLAVTARNNGDRVLLALGDGLAPPDGDLAPPPTGELSADLTSAVRRMPSANGDGGPLDIIARDGDSGQMTLLRLGRLLEDARSSYELLVLHAPDLLAVPGAIDALGATDGVVVVARLGRTDREDLTRLRAQLEALGLPALGIVTAR